MRKYYILLLGLIITANCVAQQAEVKLFSISSIWKEKAFIPLTEAYPIQDNQYIPKAQEGELPNRGITLGTAQRKSYLEKAGIAETDSVYFYLPETGTYIASTIKELSLAAKLEVYDYNPNNKYNYQDYQIGLQIKETSNNTDFITGESLIAIGKENPFVLQALEKIQWEEIPNAKHPASIHQAIIAERKKFKVTPDDKQYSYYFENQQFIFYYQITKRREQTIFSKLVVLEAGTKKRVLDTIFEDSEWSDVHNPGSQYTGRILKDQPAVIMGFIFDAFGFSGFTCLATQPKTLRIYTDLRDTI